MAHRVLVRLSTASTTLPNVPWPSKRHTWSTKRQNTPIVLHSIKLTSIAKMRIWVDDVVTVFIVDLLMGRHELCWLAIDHIQPIKSLTSRIGGT